MFPEDDAYRDDPKAWLDEVLGAEHWSKQDEIFESVRDHRYTAVQSCHGIGKSWTAAQIAAWWLSTHPLGDAFVVTTAPTWRQVQAILWREIRRTQQKANLDGRTTLDAQWYMGGSQRGGESSEELVAMGRKPSDYDPDAFQGIHALYVLVIIDEACGVPKLLYDAVDSLVTNDYARVLAIGNPDDPASQFEKVCRPGSGWNRIKVSYADTPNFTGEPVSERLSQLLIGRTWVDERRKRWGEKSPTFVAKVTGEFPDVTDDTLITPAMLRKAQALELPGIDLGTFGGDIARMGKDETVVYRNRGGVIRHAYGAHKQDTTATTGAFAKLIHDRRSQVPMVVDSVGIGAGVYDNLANDGLPVVPFNGGEAPYDGARFLNRRAEVYWSFRESIEAGEIDLPVEGEDEDLISQLGSIKWSINPKGKIRIETKEEMAARGMPSPDRADAAVYSTVARGAFIVPERQPNEEHETVTGDLLSKVM